MSDSRRVNDGDVKIVVGIPYQACGLKYVELKDLVIPEEQRKRLEGLIDKRIKEKSVKKEITVEFGTKDLVNKIVSQLEGKIDEIVKEKVQELLADNSRTEENCAICSIQEILKYGNPVLQSDQEVFERLDRLCEVLKERQ